MSFLGAHPAMIARGGVPIGRGEVIKERGAVSTRLKAPAPLTTGDIYTLALGSGIERDVVITMQADGNILGVLAVASDGRPLFA